MKAIIAVIVLSLQSPCSTRQFKDFRTAWNLKAQKLTVGSWRLPDYSGTIARKDSTSFKQVLDAPGIYLNATVKKTGCFKRISVSGRRDSKYDLTGLLVAETFLVHCLQPKLSNDEVNEMLKDMNMHTQSDYTVIKGQWSYTITQSLSLVTFTARPIN